MKRPRGRLRALATHPDTAGVAALTAATALAAVLALRLWEADWRVPFQSGHDANVVLAVIKNVLREGWYTTTDHLGAPFGQQFHDYPIHVGDWLSLGMVRALGLVIDGPATVMNAFYVGTYFLVAGGAYAALRLLGRSRVTAVAAALLYTFLPYHWIRGEMHLFLGAYWAVPLACVVLLRRLEPGSRLRPTWFEVAVVVVMAGTGSYYPAMFVVLLAAVALVRVIADRRLASTAGPALLVGVMLAVTALANLPTILHRLDEGSNDVAGRREFYEAEIYGARLTQMVLPVAGHRVDVLGRPAERLATTPLPYPHLEMPSLALGAAGTVGLVLLGWRVVCRLGGGAVPDAAPAWVDRAALVVMLALVLGAAGGLAPLLGLAGFTQIRAWARLGVFVAFFALAALAVAGDGLLRRAVSTRWSRLALVAPVAVLALLDQTTAATSPAYASQKARWDADERLVTQIEHALGPDAALFQLPHVPFPETPPPAAMEDYDHLRGYLHSDTLDWSFGGVKGRADVDSLEQLGALPPAQLVEEARRLGYEGLWFNRLGYGDPSALEAELTALLGPPVAAHASGDVIVFRLA
ncbi:MAG: hypothetical protein HYU28_05855 [Actinobacteria bacterium]|nr:hypothetical protein [Actinomycetota bacterium]